MNIEKIDLSKMTVSERMKTASLFGDLAGKLINAAVKKANKNLQKLGYKVSVTLNFHQIESEQGE